MTKKKKSGLSERAIRNMPYESRIQHYNRENVLFGVYTEHIKQMLRRVSIFARPPGV